MSTQPRFRSLDIFRGATVALMILVNNPGSWQHLYSPLAHAPWHGVTPTDLVFPFFLFAVGNALALVLPGLLAGPRSAFWAKVLRRTALIFLIGLLLNAMPFVRWNEAGELVLRDWHTLRTMGVLQRIALCFGAAAAIVTLAGPRGALWATAALLLGHWLAAWGQGAPGDPYSLAGYFGTAIDRALLGEAHLYKGEGVPFEPEGLASTPPAVAQVLLGWWVGGMVVQALTAKAIDSTLLARLFLWGTALLLLAYVWQLAFPFNKKIWSSSYVLHTTGLAMLALALCIHLVEVRAKPLEMWGWARFFECFGKNALFVFVLAGVVPRVLALLRWQVDSTADGTAVYTSPLPWLYAQAFAPVGAAVGDPRLGSLLYACANLALYAAIVAWLDRRRIYVRV